MADKIGYGLVKELNGDPIPIVLVESDDHPGVYVLASAPAAADATPLAVQQAQLTAARDTVVANAGAPPATPWGVSLDAATLAALETTTTLDGGPAWTSVWGVAGVPFTSPDQHSAVASVTDAPTSGQKLVITDLIVSVDTNMSVTFKEETSGTIIFGPWYCSANSGPIQVTLRSKKKLPVANKKLQVLTSVAGNITVQVGYYSE
jgi:hypothetical protein